MIVILRPGCIKYLCEGFFRPVGYIACEDFLVISIHCSCEEEASSVLIYAGHVIDMAVFVILKGIFFVNTTIRRPLTDGHSIK